MGFNFLKSKSLFCSKDVWPKIYLKAYLTKNVIVINIFDRKTKRHIIYRRIRVKKGRNNNKAL